MIRGITIANGKIRVVLVGETDIDKAVLKAIDGATCKIITDNLRVFDQTVSEGIVIEAEIKEVPERPKQLQKNQ